MQNRVFLGVWLVFIFVSLDTKAQKNVCVLSGYIKEKSSKEDLSVQPYLVNSLGQILLASDSNRINVNQLVSGHFLFMYDKVKNSISEDL